MIINLLGAVLLTNSNKMIEIIKEQVEMPSLSTERRFQKICENNKWEVIDTHNENKTIYKGSYEDVCIACHNLNKKFYRDGVI
jgi:hypothetical protein